MDKLGAVDFLCFGSECGNLKTLSRLSAILLEEPEEYRAALRLEQKKGLSFPKARSLALQHCCPFDADMQWGKIIAGYRKPFPISFFQQPENRIRYMIFNLCKISDRQCGIFLYGGRHPSGQIRGG